MMNAMDETASPWPGIVYRYSSSNISTMIANASSSVKNEYKHSSKNLKKVRIQRINNVIYLKTDSGENRKITDMTSLAHTFNVPVTFGTSLKPDGTPQRQFKGTLDNMKIVFF